MRIGRRSLSYGGFFHPLVCAWFLMAIGTWKLWDIVFMCGQRNCVLHWSWLLSFEDERLVDLERWRSPRLERALSAACAWSFQGTRLMSWFFPVRSLRLYFVWFIVAAWNIKNGNQWIHAPRSESLGIRAAHMKPTYLHCHTSVHLGDRSITYPSENCP